MLFMKRLLTPFLFLLILFFTTLLPLSATSQEIRKLPDPYDVYRKALSSDEWTLEDYARAYSFTTAKIPLYTGLGQSTLSSLETIEKWNKTAKLFLDSADVLEKFDVLKLKNPWENISSLTLLLKANRGTTKFFADYVYRLSDKTGISTEMIIEGISWLAWTAKLGTQNGLGDTGFGDLCDSLMIGATDQEKFDLNFQQYVIKQSGLEFTGLLKMTLDMLPINTLEKIGLDTLDNLPDVWAQRYTMKLKMPYAYYIIESAKIVTDLLSAWAVSEVNEDNEEKQLALSFLEYYLLAFKGDRAAFEKSVAFLSRNICYAALSTTPLTLKVLSSSFNRWSVL